MSELPARPDGTRHDEDFIDPPITDGGPSQDKAKAQLSAQGQAHYESSQTSKRESIQESVSSSNHAINLWIYRAKFWNKRTNVGGETNHNERKSRIQLGVWIGAAIVLVGGGGALIAMVVPSGVGSPETPPVGRAESDASTATIGRDNRATSSRFASDGPGPTANPTSLDNEGGDVDGGDPPKARVGDTVALAPALSVRSRQHTIPYDHLGSTLQDAGLFAWDHNPQGQRVRGTVEVSDIESPYFAQLVWCPPPYHSPMDRMGVGRDSLLVLPGGGLLFEPGATSATIDPSTNAIVTINGQPATIESYRRVMASARPGDKVRLGISVATPDGGSREVRQEAWDVRNIRTTVYRDDATGLEWIDTKAGAPLGIENAYANWWSARLIGCGARCDWRVPTIEELLTLVGPDRDGRTALRDGFDLSPSAYWSCDVMSPGTNAWYAVDFAQGRISATPEAGLLLVRTVHEHDDAGRRRAWPGHKDDFLYPVLAVDTVTPVTLPGCHVEPPAGREAPHPVPSAWLVARDRRGTQHVAAGPGGALLAGDTGTESALPHNVGGPDVEAAIRQILSGPNRATQGGDPREGDR